MIEIDHLTYQPLWLLNYHQWWNEEGDGWVCFWVRGSRRGPWNPHPWHGNDEKCCDEQLDLRDTLFEIREYSPRHLSMRSEVYELPC